MATLSRFRNPVNRLTGGNGSRLLAQAGAANIIWHSLGKIAGKEAVRDDLSDGASHSLSLAISGEIDGDKFAPIKLTAYLIAGHASHRASTVTPDVPRLVAAILAKLNDRTREAILRDLPNEFEQAGNELPDVPDALVEKVEAMLARLRAKVTAAVRGAVSCRYAVQNARPKLSVVG